MALAFRPSTVRTPAVTLPEVSRDVSPGVAPEIPLLLARIEGVQVAVPVADVVEVFATVGKFAVPFAPPGVAGAVAMHGQVCTLLDLSAQGSIAHAPYAVRLRAPLDAVALLVDTLEGVTGFTAAAVDAERESLARSIRETLGLGEQTAGEEARLNDHAQLLEFATLAEKLDPVAPAGA